MIQIFLRSLLIFLFFLFPITIQAADYRTTFNSEYIMKKDGSSDVNLIIKIVHLNPNIYVKEFAIGFPASFGIESVSVRDGIGTIQPVITTNADRIKLAIALNNPNIGRMSENFIYIQYRQKNLYKIHGNSWEVILPTINGDEEAVHHMQVILPEGSDKKISIAKPKPARIEGSKIFWENIKTRTVYAVFGESEYYKTNLSYHLENNGFRRIYYDVAFPPDMTYQKVFVLSIEPPPEKITIDEDGNYLGRYTLNLKEKKDVFFDGIIEVTAKKREEPYLLDQERIKNQKTYLLTPQSFWDIESFIDSDEIKSIKNIDSIYRYTSDSLTYNYNRISKNMKRMGAEEILKNPSQAVCMEFTDLFIALARQNGIYARELNGYGFSDDDRFRPQLLNTDILHSWPQYYDEEKASWISVDPTWENTSGIDYFSSLDLNHITFVIHGKEQNYPVSAGMYKTEDTKDISIVPVESIPQTHRSIIMLANIPSHIMDSNEHTIKLIFKNEGNTFVYDYPISINLSNLAYRTDVKKISVIAPYQEVMVNLILLPTPTKRSIKSHLVISSGDEVLLEKTIIVMSSFVRLITTIVGILFGLIIFGSLLLIIAKKNRL